MDSRAERLPSQLPGLLLAREGSTPRSSSQPGSAKHSSPQSGRATGQWGTRGSVLAPGKRPGSKGSEALDKAQAEAYFSDLLSYR